MKKNRFINIILSIACIFMISGCEKSESVDTSLDITDVPSSALSMEEESSITPTMEPSTVLTVTPTEVPTDTESIMPTLTLQECSMESYEKFLKNEATISFDRFMPVAYGYLEEPLFKEGTEYTLSQVLDIVIAYYLENSTDKTIKNIEYAYIDCGKDGVNELALRFYGVDFEIENDDSTLVFVIKYIDEKLSLCYFYETWSRSESTLNEYGYCKSGGSGGASLHITETSLIDGDGNWKPIVSIESETNIDMMGKISDVAKTKGIKDGIQLDTICFDYDASNNHSDGDCNQELFYTFYVYDDNWELIEDANLYTNSIYQEIFNEAQIPYITPEELSTMILEQEEKVGATAEIKEGADIAWKTLTLK